jgi:hypothetical protein
MLGTIAAVPDDVPALGELPHSEASIRAAVGRIENPELRIIDRLFWFHSDKASTVETKTFFAHDLALSDLFGTFAEDIDEACIRRWSKALRSWQEIVANDDYWAQISELEFEGGFEPTAFPSEIEELRSRAVELAAEPLVVAGREAVGRNDAATVRLILAALETLDGMGGWAKSAQLDIASPLIERFKSLCKGLRGDFEPQIVRKENAARQNAISCAAELARFRADVRPELDKLAQQLPPGSEALQEAREEAALLLGAIASDFTWADEFIESEQLYEDALKLAENTLGSISIQAALERIRSSAHQQRVRGKPVSSAPALFQLNGCGFTIYGSYDVDQATRSYATNYYFTFLWLPIFPIARYRVISTGGRKYRFLGKLPLRKGDRWHLGIALSTFAIFLVIAMVSGSTSRDSYSGSITTPTNSSPPSDGSTEPGSSVTPTSDSSSGDSVAPSTPIKFAVPAESSSGDPSNGSTLTTSNDTELSELRQRIEAGRSEMTDITDRLKPVMDELSTINDRVTFLKSEIDDLKQQEESGTEIDTDHYNSIVDDYNGWLSRKQALIEENKTDLDRLDTLQKADDVMLQRWKALGGKVE